MHRFFLIIALCFLTSVSMYAIIPGQKSDFQDGTIQGWGGGAIKNVVLGGGPAGASDNYLNIKTDPQSNRVGSRLATYNEDTAWIGNYQAAGITQINMDLLNTSDTLITLEVRLVFFGPGTPQSATRFTSTQAISIAPDNQWHSVAFPINEASMTRVFGLDTYDAVMQGVTRILVRHQPGNPGAGAPAVVAAFGLDNIEAVGQVANPGGIQVSAFLNGFYQEGLGTMHADLAASLIPAAQPYSQVPWNYQGTESLGAIPDSMTDWVLVELRSTQDRSLVISAMACMIMRSGIIREVGGAAELSLDFQGADSAYVVVHHQSHLSVISAIAITPGASYDFRVSIQQALGTEQMLRRNDGAIVLYSGDYDGNGIINNQDFNSWKQNGAAINQYLPIDGDGNGIINNLDFNLWAANPSKVGLPEIQY